jgi:hypothetical protein
MRAASAGRSVTRAERTRATLVPRPPVTALVECVLQAGHPRPPLTPSSPGSRVLSARRAVAARRAGGLDHGSRPAMRGRSRRPFHTERVAVATPPGNDGGGLFNSSFLGDSFVNFGNEYSMGVAGVASAVPEPSTCVRLGIAAAALASRAWHMRKHCEMEEGSSHRALALSSIASSGAFPLARSRKEELQK